MRPRSRTYRAAHIDSLWRLLHPAGDPFGGATRTAIALLGDQHPLVQTLDRLGVLMRQSLAVAVFVGLGAVDVARGASRAWSLLGAATVVELALGAGIALLVQLKRECAREVIIEGHEDLPLPAIAAERDRLLDLGERRRLARALEQIVRAAENYDRLLIASRPPPGTRRLREIAHELRDVAARLRAQDVGVRGVARVARLLTGGYGSPFYAGPLEEVRQEVDRIRAELADGTDSGLAGREKSGN